MSVMNPAALVKGTGYTLAPGTLTATTVGSGVDCLGADYALVVLIFGTVSSSNTATIKVYQSADDASAGTYAAITGATYTCTGGEDNTVVFGAVRLHGKSRYLKLVYTETATGQSTVLGAALIPMKMQDDPGDMAADLAFDVL